MFFLLFILFIYVSSVLYNFTNFLLKWLSSAYIPKKKLVFVCVINNFYGFFYYLCIVAGLLYTSFHFLRQTNKLKITLRKNIFSKFVHSFFKKNFAIKFFPKKNIKILNFFFTAYTGDFFRSLVLGLRKVYKLWQWLDFSRTKNFFFFSQKNQ